MRMSESTPRSHSCLRKEQAVISPNFIHESVHRGVTVAIVKRGKLCIVVYFAIMIWIGGGTATADNPDTSEPAWIPTFELGVDAQFDDRTASVSSNFAPHAVGSDTNSITIVRFGAEILGPQIKVPYLGRPRLLMRVGGQFSLLDKEILSAGDPSETNPGMVLDAAIAEGMLPNPRRDTLADLDANSLPGRGAYVRARHNTRPTWYAALGASWQFRAPLYDGWIRIKPAIEYTADEFRYDGLVVNAIEPSADTFEVTRLRQGRRVREHRVGPGLELELGLLDSRPFTVSFFVATRLLFLVSDRYNSWGDSRNITTEIFDDTNGRQPGSSAGKNGTFTVKSERHMFRFGGGVRISWMGLK